MKMWSLLVFPIAVFGCITFDVEYKMISKERGGGIHVSLALPAIYKELSTENSVKLTLSTRVGKTPTSLVNGPKLKWAEKGWKEDDGSNTLFIELSNRDPVTFVIPFEERPAHESTSNDVDSIWLLFHHGQPRVFCDGYKSDESFRGLEGTYAEKPMEVIHSEWDYTTPCLKPKLSTSYSLLGNDLVVSLALPSGVGLDRSYLQVKVKSGVKPLALDSPGWPFPNSMMTHGSTKFRVESTDDISDVFVVQLIGTEPVKFILRNSKDHAYTYQKSRFGSTQIKVSKDVWVSFYFHHPGLCSSKMGQFDPTLIYETSPTISQKPYCHIDRDSRSVTTRARVCEMESLL